MRVTLGAVGLGGLMVLFCFAYALADMRSFEWAPLYIFVGLRGIGFITVLTAGLVIITGMSLSRAVRGRPYSGAPRRKTFAFLTLWALLVLWFADWVFVDDPLTVQLRETLITQADQQRAADEAVRRFGVEESALVALHPQLDKRELALMFARIRVNRPTMFEGVSIGSVIAETAKRYGVSPVLLTHWVYIDSWYGEAPAGPMPFFAEMNGEMFRDLVQAHLPWWFVESPIRIALINGPWFGYLVPKALAVKLKYAVQKADYDIAISPFMNSVMSDLFLTMRDSPAEFPELFDEAHRNTDPLAKSFLALRDVGLLEPYHDPYASAPRTKEYYREHRKDLITFGRAAVYRLTTDFRFATKAQALIARYYAGQYAQRIGPERWAQLSERQQTSLLAMLRDVYMPNIGHTAYNDYMVPELNTTPIVYLAGEVAKHFDAVSNPNKTWLPPDNMLWGATGLMIRVLGQVWKVMDGTPLPGMIPAETVQDALLVLARND